MSLLYQLGEGAAEETLKPGSGSLGQLATGESKLFEMSVGMLVGLVLLISMFESVGKTAMSPWLP